MIQIVVSWKRLRPTACLCAVLSLCCALASAEDWPAWRGKDRLGVWNETNILDKFPEGGLDYVWRVPIKEGYGGPSVADGRVYVTDFWRPEPNTNKGIERLLCLSEATGEIQWTKEWPIDTTKLQRTYANGPRCTPAVDGDRVYVLGSVGNLFCLNVKNGETIWSKDFVKDFGLQIPSWGMSGHPLIDGEKLICLVGGEPDAKVVAFDKLSGNEIWRSLPANSEPGYCPPVIINFAGVRQLIIWHPIGVASLNPETGKVYWEYEHPLVYASQTIATPVLGGNKLLVSSFEPGTTVLELDSEKPGAKFVWKSEGAPRTPERGLQAFMSSPFVIGDYVYGNGGLGHLTCININTGEIKWQTFAATEQDARQALAFLVKNGDRFFISNDRGELIIAKLSPEGYEEISRAEILEPTNKNLYAGVRRERNALLWVHPAYANGHIVHRNDKEIVRVSLVKK